jgi:hypothetical protein
VAAPIEGYASAASVAANEALDFHVRSDESHRDFAMQIYRRGLTDQLVAERAGKAAVIAAQNDAALAVNGCQWPIAEDCRVLIPPEWRSGYYVAKLSSGNAAAWIPFVVRAPSPAATSKILVKLSDTTTQAYNGWGGRSFYSTPFSPRISFDRPYDDLGLYEKYQLPWIQWAEKNSFALDFCSSLDLHADPNLLRGYQLLASLGHDEYWSLEMRDQVEAFIASGGNVCFFSANTCFWQVRFDLSAGRRIMICYKEAEAGHSPDPDRSDLHRVTTQWSKPPVNRPENSMTGVSYRNGAGWWNDPIDPARRFRGYAVVRSKHWVFDGTGLSDGDTFGKGQTVDDTILGYETDAAIAVAGSSPPLPSGSDGTPKNLVFVATADLRDWASGGQGGYATMGIYQRNGMVFTGGTVNWVGGLSLNGDETPVDRITRNLLERLQSKLSTVFPLENPGFEEWQDRVAVGWALDGAGSISAESTGVEARRAMRFGADQHSVTAKIDATAGETWLTQSELTFDPRKTYAAGCWALTSQAGATLRLQSTDTWADFATAAHSGGGGWEYIFAVGSLNDGAAPFPARVKIQVAAGTRAWFDDVSVMEITD